MAKKGHEPILENHLRKLYPTDKNTVVPLKDLSQLPFIFDTLSRKAHHHIALLGTNNEKFNFIFLENIAQYLNDDAVAKILRETTFYYLDLAQIIVNANDAEQVETDFKTFISSMAANHKRIILAVNQMDTLFEQNPDSIKGVIAKHLKSLIANEQWRLIAIGHPQQLQIFNQHPWFKANFSNVRLGEPNAADSLAILKTFRDDLENFHHVIIPDESFAYALSMANHYLSGTQANLEKALQLLDSGAARASVLEKNEQGHKPVLTNAILANTVSNWTKIPLSHLQHNKFKANEFMQGIQKTIFGQDAAIHLVALALQYARIKLQIKPGPLCSFLFAGPQNVGKSETAYAIAEQLFGHKGALLRVNLDKTATPTSLADIKVVMQTDELQSPSLLDAIAQSPYAVVLLENVNQAPPGIIDLFHDILTQGYAMDTHGNKYDFRHAIVIITTTLGAERIISLTQPQPSGDSAQTLDLMQLVLNEPTTQDTSSAPHQSNMSPQELAEEMMPALETYFSMNLLRHLNIVPFALLDYAGIEKIVRLKLKALTKQLDTHFTIELTYSPEVVRFLVQETLWRGETTRPIDKTLEHHLYSCVAHELLSHIDDKNRPKRLQLQLNDSGQLLRAEFLQSADTSTLYQL
jgi:ATP-dependent Clp protease ATP-binding subunit ClpA